MYIPEYTITPNILKSVANIEFNRSFIENTSILPNFEQRLVREAEVEFIISSYKFQGENVNPQEVKISVDKMSNSRNPKIDNVMKAISSAIVLAQSSELSEKDIKRIHSLLCQDLIPGKQATNYRNRKIPQKTDPQEILAEIFELIDWLNSLDAMDTNPVLVSGIVKGRLEIIHPFEFFNAFISSLFSKVILLNRGYDFTKYTCVESYYNSSIRDYEQNLSNVLDEEGDLTAWLEYYVTAMATQTATAVEKVKLYARDTKLAKANGRIYLSKRQEKIVEYLQDYGILQNKQFSTLFPQISEDSVLRDIKKLLHAGVIVKRGSTKSSRYELR